MKRRVKKVYTRKDIENALDRIFPKYKIELLEYNDSETEFNGKVYNYARFKINIAPTLKAAHLAIDEFEKVFTNAVVVDKGTGCIDKNNSCIGFEFISIIEDNKFIFPVDYITEEHIKEYEKWMNSAYKIDEMFKAENMSTSSLDAEEIQEIYGKWVREIYAERRKRKTVKDYIAEYKTKGIVFRRHDLIGENDMGYLICDNIKDFRVSKFNDFYVIDFRVAANILWLEIVHPDNEDKLSEFAEMPENKSLKPDSYHELKMRAENAIMNEWDLDILAKSIGKSMWERNELPSQVFKEMRECEMNKKPELKTGMECIIGSAGRGTVMLNTEYGDVISYKNGGFDFLNDEIINKISEIYHPYQACAVLKYCEDKPIWKRTKQMTLAEIKKELGYPVEIMEEK